MMTWASINEVVPNPKNPRSNLTVKAAEMQQIIKQKGWETGITCYEKDSKYIILSGHRRWYAAKKLKIKKVPVIIVEAPKSDDEELKRLGSVQGGKEDWTDYEWAKYTYEMWVTWGKCSFEELSQKMRRKNRWVAERVRVLQYYPHHEIEKGLIERTLSLKVLYRLIGWLEKLSIQKPELVAFFNLDLIRSTMLQKIENRLVNISDLKNEGFIRESSDEQLKSFLLDNKKKLSDYFLEIKDNNHLTIRTKSQPSQQNLRNITSCLNQTNLENITNFHEMLMQINIIRNEIFKKQGQLKTLLQGESCKS